MLLPIGAAAILTLDDVPKFDFKRGGVVQQALEAGDTGVAEAQSATRLDIYLFFLSLYIFAE